MGVQLRRGWLAAWSALHRLAEAETGFVARFPDLVGRHWPEAPLVGFDVGASVGVYSREMARICERVHAIEPHAPQAAFLRACALERVEVLEAAASWFAGTATLHDRSGGWRRPEATLEARPGATWRAPCRTIQLDSLVDAAEAHHPGFAALVKIDVEGHEGAVLAGAERLMARRHVCLLVEIEARLNPRFAAVFGWLASRGYAAHRYEGGGLVPAGPADVAAMQGRRGGRFARLRGYRNNFVFLRKPG